MCKLLPEYKVIESEYLEASVAIDFALPSKLRVSEWVL